MIIIVVNFANGLEVTLCFGTVVPPLDTSHAGHWEGVEASPFLGLKCRRTLSSIDALG